MFVQPTLMELATTADATVAALHALGYKCCFFGGFACRLYGSTRLPEDIDVVVLETSAGANQASQEAIKRQLVVQDSRFYLVEPKTYGATYKVLWFRLSPSHSCKVDVLLPGILNIPDVAQEDIVHRQLQFSRYDLLGSRRRFDGPTSSMTKAKSTAESSPYPLMPLPIVLLLKLQGWADHRVALKRYMRMKVTSDVQDISILLTVASTTVGVKSLADESFVPAALVEAAKERVSIYSRLYPSTASAWRALGFSTMNATRKTPRRDGPFGPEFLESLMAIRTE